MKTLAPPAAPKVQAAAYPRTITFKTAKKASLKKSRRTKIK